MRRQANGVRAGAAAVLVAGFGLAACGSSTTAASVSPRAAVAAAYGRTVGGGSARVAITSTTAVAGRTVMTNTTGVERWQAPAASLTTSISASGLPAGSEVIHERLIGTSAYVELPAKLRGALGKPWIGITGMKVQASPTAVGSNPAGILALLEADATSIRKVGTARVGGVATTEYRLVVDVRKAEASASPAARAVLMKVGASFSSATLPVTAWIDAAGRVRQLRLTEALAVHGIQATTAVQIRFSDFGVPVHVTAPPLSQTRVIPFSTFARSAGSSLDA